MSNGTVRTAESCRASIIGEARPGGAVVRHDPCTIESSIRTFPDESLALVQLWHVDVDPEDLRLEGADLHTALAEYQPMELVFDTNELPEGGWRIVAARSGDATFGPRVELAAPHPEHRDGWAMISLVRKAGRWLASAHPGPVVAIPGRAARRQQLELRWPQEPLTARAGAVPDLSVELHNVSRQPLSTRYGAEGTYMEDDLGVLARLLDASGNYLSPMAWRHRSGFQPVPALAPGQAIVLAVQLVDEAVSDLPAGEYGVLATLVSLNLQSKPGLLRLT